MNCTDNGFAPGRSPRFRTAWMSLVLASCYFIAGWFGLTIPYSGSFITLVWLPTGISVAALLRFGSSLWPGVYVGAFAVNLLIGSSPLLAACIAVGNTLAPLLGVYGLKRGGFHSALDRQRDIFLLCLVAAGSMTLSASGGVLSLYMAGLLAREAIFSSWLTWWLGDSVGVLLGAPLLLTLSLSNVRQVKQHFEEFVIWLLIACTVAWVAFVRDYEVGRSLPLSFLTLPLLAWPALRFGITGASLAALSLSVAAAWGTATGHGTFHIPDVHLGLFLLWTYMVTAVLTGLLITALLFSGVRAHAELERERDEKQRYLDIAGSVIVVLGADGKVRQINPAGCALLGRGETEIVGQDWFDLCIPAAARENVRNIFRRLMGGTVASVRFVESMVVNSRGEERIVAWHNAVLRDARGTITGTLSSGEDITDRKRYEESLVRGREELRAILDATTESVFLMDRNSIVLAINSAAAKRLDREPTELLGKYIYDYFPAEVARHRLQTANEVIATGTPRYTEDDRGPYSFALNYYPVLDEGRQVTGYVVFGIDITARKQSERKTLALLQRNQLLMDTAIDGIHIVDLDGRLIEANEAFCTMLGYTKEEAALLTIFDWEAQWPREELEPILRRLVGSPEKAKFETIHRRKNGERINVEVHARSVLLDGARYLYASSRDITERKKAEKLLAESEERYRLTVEAINEGMWDWELGSGNIVCDARWYSILGYAPGEFAMSYDALLWRVHPDDLVRVKEDMERLAQSRDTVVSEFRFRDSVDAWRWLQGRAKAVEWNEDGSPRRVVGTHADISRRKAAENELQQSKDRLHMLLTSMQDRVLVFDTGGYVTESFAGPDEHGPYLPPELFMGRSYDEVLPSDVSTRFSEAIAGILMDGKPKTFEFSLTAEYGDEYVSMATMSPLMGGGSYPVGFIAVIRDITSIRQSQHEVERLAQKNALLLESLGEGVCGVDRQGNVTFVNSAALLMLGLRADEVVGMDPHRLFHHHRQDGSPYPEEECSIVQTLADGQSRHAESEWYWHRDGHGFPVSMTVTPILESGRSVGAVVVFQDISERKKTEDEIFKLAYFDPLTRLPNRRLLLDRIAQSCLNSERTHANGALLFIDLDNFKVLNDTVGHEAGDHLLQQVAQRLAECVRSQDTVARLGGDEFVVLLSGLAKEDALALSQAMAIAEKIRVSLGEPYAVAGLSHRSTPSIGIAAFKGKGVAVEELLRRADAAMYKAKAAGRNVVRIWQDV
ncbi:MAG: PAS domain S-box protein [Rhodocyclaceae bacterium]|nr:MAG: PAS domain S-box protein [Rhodocyclaceae bacterium]